MNTLFDIEHIKRRTMVFDMQEMHLNTLITFSLSLFKDAHSDYSVTFTSTISEREDDISGDWNKLIQVFTNILENAVKYSKENKSITISLHKTQNEFIIETIDNGIGIASKKIPKIFQRYYQAESMRQDGLGLGLYLVKYIIRKHHGSVHAESELGKGTKIIITLPSHL